MKLLKPCGVRLVVAIPLTLFIFTLSSGFLVMKLAQLSPRLSSADQLMIAVWLISFSLLALGTGAILAYAIVKPINSIVRRTRDLIGEVPPSEEGDNEIESLKNAFEKLMSSLQDKLSRDERAQAERIRDGIRRVEHLASLGLLSLGLAHEIRNPLGYLRGLVELIDRDLDEGDRRKTYTKVIVRGIDRLNELVEKLLALSKLSEVELEPVALEEVLDDSLAPLRDKLSSKGLQLSWDRGSGCVVQGDRVKLRHLFSNLLDNAIEATPEGGAIEIRVERSGPSIKVSIRNTGSYIPPEERERIFEPFYTKREGGTGLGLFIARQIALAHSGEISVESDPQLGTAFTVELPASGGEGDAGQNTHRGGR